MRPTYCTTCCTFSDTPHAKAHRMTHVGVHNGLKLGVMVEMDSVAQDLVVMVPHRTAVHLQQCVAAH